MPDLSKAEAEAKSLIVAWYAHPVPLWVAGVALLVGAVLARVM